MAEAKRRKLKLEKSKFISTKAYLHWACSLERTADVYIEDQWDDEIKATFLIYSIFFSYNRLMFTTSELTAIFVGMKCFNYKQAILHEEVDSVHMCIRSTSIMDNSSDSIRRRHFRNNLSVFVSMQAIVYELIVNWFQWFSENKNSNLACKSKWSGLKLKCLCNTVAGYIYL